MIESLNREERNRPLFKRYCILQQYRIFSCAFHFYRLGIGVYLDGKFDTGPWCTLIFIGLGIAAGYRNIGLAIKKSRNF